MPAPAQPAFRVVRLDPGKEHAAPRLTGRGAAVIAACLMMLVGGALTRDGDLMALGVAGLVLLAPVAALCWWNLRNLELAADVPPKVVAEEKFACRLRVRNLRPLGDAFHIRAEHQLPGGGTLRFHAPWTPAGGESEVLMHGSVPRRGVFGGAKVLLSSSFPLGLFSLATHGMVTETMLVMPRPLIPKSLDDQTLAQESEMAVPRPARAPSPGELHGLRSYRPGDPLKFIHWPASTRGMGLVVREFDQPMVRPRLAVVVFHSASDERSLLRPEHFESALRLLAGIVLRLQHLGIPAEVRADFLDWRPVRCASAAESTRFHASLAKVERARQTTPGDAMLAIQSAPPDAILVALSDLPLSGWENTLHRAAGKRAWFSFDPSHTHDAQPAKPTRRKGAAA